MSIITVKNLSKTYPVAVKEPGLAGTFKHFLQRTYRHITAVKDVSFDIEPGEIVGFLGPNGAGKTTTLKMLTGLIHPSSGLVRVADRIPFQRDRQFLEKITLVMGQKQQLLWDLPALDSLKINAAVYGISDRLFSYRINELSEALNLGDKLKQPVRKLSLGERMKVELLAALIHQPQILFMDEPTLGLDVNAQAGIREFLKYYNQQYQATILLTSHYMADITALCDRVLLIYEGGLIYDGRLDGLLEHFAPYREVRLELASPITDEAGFRLQTSSYGDLVELETQSARFFVARDRLTATVSQILAELAIIDLSITDPPIEEIIGRVFKAGKV